MAERLDELLVEARRLERAIAGEIKQRAEDLQYKIERGRVIFSEEIRRRHKAMSLSIGRFLIESSILNILTAPIIYSVLMPLAALDLLITLYQSICFRIYGIPRVLRRDHVAFDRHKLQYLNLIEKVNCFYCSYANGVISYAREIAARTEQYWCPIRHAARLKNPHSRYHLFLDYGDSADYHARLKDIRSQFDELRKDADSEK